MSNIGIFGGAFDPPHTGHLIIAEQARQIFKLNKIVWIPLNIPTHKPSVIASAKHRFDLVKLAISDNPYFEISDIEIKRKGKSFMIDTLMEFKKNIPSSNIFLIIGIDEAKNFHKWKDYKKIPEFANIIVIGRPGIEYTTPQNMKLLPLMLDISSTKIREFIKQKISIKYLVPNSVEKYIKNKKLYTKPLSPPEADD
ncbi:MAG: nicotinate-nucleotide adenylyltransferase [bacterium]|nr:nicotinate-nucleotide adenylyltransferase [bacterium]